MFHARTRVTISRPLTSLVCSVALVSLLAYTAPAISADSQSDIQNLVVPLNRSSLVTLPSPMAEVMVANPAIADVHAHNATHLTVVAKQLGRTNVRVFDKSGALLRDFEVNVGHDLPAIRRALKNFLPDEAIGVEMVNTSIALTGMVSGAEASARAEKIVGDFLRSGEQAGGGANGTLLDAFAAGTASGAGKAGDKNTASDPEILNLLKVTSGQQVMLRVRVGEINREALKNLGVDLNVLSDVGSTGAIALGTGGGIGSLVAPGVGETALLPGQFLLPGGRSPTNTRGVLTGGWSTGALDFSVLVKALERDGLFKLLAEPNLVAVSGEQAEFLAGGEIPIPVLQGTGASTSIGIEYKPFGVAVRFTPMVLSENRIRMQVQPEVSDISSENAVKISGFDIPSISTRRAKTTVELAPGESFMIAGLIKDQMRASIDQLPGAKELPVLGALFRSNEFKRNETELVIAVTPYIVDPMKGADVKLPTDEFRPPSQMDMFLYGALSGLKSTPAASPASPPPASDTQAPVSGKGQPRIEGPVGFMVD